MSERPNKAGLIRDIAHRAGLRTVGNKITDLVGTAWRVVYTNGTGDLTELALGASGTALVSGGASAAPSFVDVVTQAEMTTHTGAADPHTGYVLESLVDAKGDLITATAADTVARLAVGSDGTFLKADSAQSTGLAWGSASSMLKTANEGFKTIPTQPSNGTAVAQSATANTFGSWVEMTASTAAAHYIVGARVAGPAGGATHLYLALSIGTGAGGAETEIGQIVFPGRDEGADEGPIGLTIMLPAFIPVATTTRIACRTASSVASALAHLVTLIIVDQADVSGI